MLQFIVRNDFSMFGTVWSKPLCIQPVSSVDKRIVIGAGVWGSIPGPGKLDTSTLSLRRFGGVLSRR